MTYTRFVQVGRVARINYGPQEGKLATIVDILSDKRVLVDGEGISRQVMPIKRLQLTKQILGVGRGVRSGKLHKLIKKQNVQKSFDESSLGRAFGKQARRQSLNDFERYKVVCLRRRLSKLSKVKKTAKKGKK